MVGKLTQGVLRMLRHLLKLLTIGPGNNGSYFTSGYYNGTSESKKKIQS
jgi:hypothetical protein